MFNTNSDTLKSILHLYGQTEESLRKDVANLKKWMKSQPHLPEALDDKSIENFLILNKFSIERTKQSLDMYYTVRTHVTELCENVNPKKPHMIEMLDIAYWVPLPKLTENMYRVNFFKMRRKELVDKMEPKNGFGLGLNLYELRLKEDIIFGDIVIFDMEGVNFGYVAKITPAFFAKYVMAYEKIYRIPVKAVYVLNAPSYVSTVLGLVKTMVKPKIFERIHVCKDTSILKERLSSKILPKDYGGEEKSMEELQDLVKNKLRQYQDHFDKLDVLKVNESLRPKKLENDELLGFYGNFKKLNVD